LSEESLIAEHLIAYLANQKTPLAIVVGGEHDPSLTQLYDQLRQRNLGLLLIVPILMGDRLIGLFELKTGERLFLGEQDLALAQSVGTTAGRAIETARLYQSLQHHASVLEETVAQRTYELRSERDRIQAILQALGEAVIITDVSGSIQYLNPAAMALTGYTEAEAKGQNWRLIESTKTSEQESTQRFNEISELVGAGHTWRGEVNHERKNGSAYDALLTVAPLFDPDSSEDLVGFVCVQSDITDLKEAQRLRMIHQEHEKQAALDRLRHTFLSTINHELRTPLALIFQTLEMLEGSQLGEMTEEQSDALMALRRQAWTLGRMVEGLTRVAAFLSKQETVRPVLARLEPVLDTVIPLAEFKARTKEITVETEIAAKLPFFPLDVKQMEEVLTQLVDNAIKFNQTSGKIRISAQAHDDWITIAVSDSGVGIEAEQMNRIWEVFEQGSDPLKRAQEGLGLGLVLARYIVEAHRGTIEIESILNRGSTVTIRLPRTEMTIARPVSD
jgi:PAS domain S-box-containing protein